MKHGNPLALRALLCGLVGSLAACGSTTVGLSPDASTDAPPADAPPTDGPLDVPSRDVPSTDVPPGDVPAVDVPGDSPGDAPRVDVPTDGPCAATSDAGTTPCTATRVFPCGLPEGQRPMPDGSFTTAQCMALCPPNDVFQSYSCNETSVSSTGAVTLQCNYACGVGRRADGFAWTAGACDGVGDWFAHLSALEGAAVHAFAHMATALRAWGAPEALVDDALAARDDEARHTALMASLAARFGARPVPFTVAPEGPVSPAALALDNAVEGCVRETWGALVAWWQADHAPDAEIAAALRTIADDETRHAALSWRLHAWLSTQLTDAERDAVRAAHARALADLRDELTAPFPAAAIAHAGAPDRDTALRLFDALAPALG